MLRTHSVEAKTLDIWDWTQNY